MRTMTLEEHFGSLAAILARTKSVEVPSKDDRRRSFCVAMGCASGPGCISSSKNQGRHQGKFLH